MSDQKKTYGETALLTPANLLTAFRLFITPVFIWLIVSTGASWISTVVGFIAAVSDYFDGIVVDARARRARVHFSIRSPTKSLCSVRSTPWCTSTSCGFCLCSLSRPANSG